MTMTVTVTVTVTVTARNFFAMQVIFREMDKKKYTIDILSLANEYEAIHQAIGDRSTTERYKVGMQHDVHEFATAMYAIAEELGKRGSSSQAATSSMLEQLLRGEINIKTTLEDPEIEYHSQIKTEEFYGPAELTVRHPIT
jgi:hypothetical protein